MFEGERRINSSYGMIVDHIMKKKGYSMQTMADLIGVSRQQLYNQLNTNAGVEKFLGMLEKMGYGITIRPLNLGDGLVDLSEESICSNCAYKRMGDALQDLKYLGWGEGGSAKIEKEEPNGNEAIEVE